MSYNPEKLLNKFVDTSEMAQRKHDLTGDHYMVVQRRPGGEFKVVRIDTFEAHFDPKLWTVAYRTQTGKPVSTFEVEEKGALAYGDFEWPSIGRKDRGKWKTFLRSQDWSGAREVLAFIALFVGMGLSVRWAATNFDPAALGLVLAAMAAHVLLRR